MTSQQEKDLIFKMNCVIEQRKKDEQKARKELEEKYSEFIFEKTENRIRKEARKNFDLLFSKKI